MGFWKLKFPCGMEIEGNSLLNYFGEGELSNLYNDGCPIHGKKCSRVPYMKGK